MPMSSFLEQNANDVFRRLYSFRGVLLLGLIFSTSAKQPSFSFAAERIEISVLDSVRFRVRGEYIFHIPSRNENRISVFYPVPTGESLSFPLDFGARIGGTPQPFNPDPRGRGFYIDLFDISSPICTLTVRYTQISDSGDGRYILRSTATWGKPLVWGEYMIEHPIEYQLDTLNYSVDTSWSETGRRYYQFEKRNFMPTRDILFSWSLSKEEDTPSVYDD